MTAGLWANVCEVVDRIEELGEFELTVLFNRAIEEDRRRSPAGEFPNWRTPWAEVRHLVRLGQVRLRWRQMHPTLGLTRLLADRRWEITLHTNSRRTEATTVLAHELEHVRRGWLYGPDTDPRFVAEEEWLTEGYAAHRYSCNGAA